VILTAGSFLTKGNPLTAPCVLGAQNLGALSIHVGTLPSERLLLILQQFQATAMWTTVP
jgi:hypothetical protein